VAEEARTEGEKPDVDRTPVYRQLWFFVLIAIILGIAFGLLFEEQALKAQWLADAFIQLIKAVTGPVIFVTVVIGISSLGDMARAGGLALRALGYFLTMTVVALTLGLLAGNIVQPGSGFEGEVSASAKADAKESIGEAGDDQGLVSFITDDLLPSSFVSPFVENEILRVLVLAILTAAAVSSLPKLQREQVVGVFEVASQVIFRIIRLIMWAAPSARSAAWRSPSRSSAAPRSPRSAC
jgi:aerobic C4-dicarboxylate transport protein